MNDILCLFSNSVLQENRDNIYSIGKAKNIKRSESDGPLARLATIFYKWAQMFNNPNLVFEKPDRAQHLSTYQ